MKQKSQEWIGMKKFLIVILLMGILAIIDYVVWEITDNGFLVPAIALAMAIVAWVWIKSRSKQSKEASK